MLQVRKSHAPAIPCAPSVRSRASSEENADLSSFVRGWLAHLRGTWRALGPSPCLPQTYLFKLASPGQEKAMLLLESGVRFHTTRSDARRIFTKPVFRIQVV